MKATLKGRYEGDKATAVAVLAAPAGDLRLKASLSNASFQRGGGPSLDGLHFILEKPGSFFVELSPSKKDVRFQFMNTAQVLDKPVSMTYAHSWPESRTRLDCSVAFDPANKLSVGHSLGHPGVRIKYTYAHGLDRRTLIEPSFDTAKNAWDFATSYRFDGGDTIRSTYNTSSKLLCLEWNRDSKINGSFKISAAVNVADHNKAPKIVAESMWTYEI